MKKIIHLANERGNNDIGWLKANFSFSFGSYYNPDKIHFGALRVLNDDTIAAGKGFGSHPHDNMEIISIVLSGALEHQDSMGNIGTIKAGEVQVMSAGTGIMHSEYNPSKTEETQSLQIWLFPKEMNIEPRYDQRSFVNDLEINKLTTIVSSDKNGEALYINQDATFSMGDLDTGKEIKYEINKPGNGVYIFIIEGSIEIDSTVLNKRDAIGVYDSRSLTIQTQDKSRLLIMEVPMM